MYIEEEKYGEEEDCKTIIILCDCRVLLVHKLEEVLLAGELKLVQKEAHNKSTMCSHYSSLSCCSLSPS